MVACATSRRWVRRAPDHPVRGVVPPDGHPRHDLVAITPDGAVEAGRALSAMRDLCAGRGRNASTCNPMGWSCRGRSPSTRRAKAISSCAIRSRRVSEGSRRPPIGATFAHDHGGVHIGGVTGIDARGEKVVQARRGGTAGPCRSLARGSSSRPVPLSGSRSTRWSRFRSRSDRPLGGLLRSGCRIRCEHRPLVGGLGAVFSGGAWTPWYRSCRVRDSWSALCSPSIRAASSSVCVADLGVRNRFGIVYIRGGVRDGGAERSRFRTVDAATGVVGSGATLTTSSHPQ